MLEDIITRDKILLDIKKLWDGPLFVRIEDNIYSIVLKPKEERAAGSMFTPTEDQYTRSKKEVKNMCLKIKDWVDQNYRPEASWIEPDGSIVGFVLG